MSAERRYLSLDGFRDLARQVRDPSAIETANLTVLSGVPVEVKAVDGEERLLKFIITSDRVDREQDTLAANGWDMKAYKKNPVVLWAHDHYMPPIARSRSITKDGTTWVSEAEFMDQELSPFSFMVYRMYVEKFLHAVSVGFQPQEWKYNEDRKYGIDYLKQELLEYSCVPVPANPDALVIARKSGIDTTPLRVWAERLLDSSKGLSDEARHRAEVLRAASSPSGRALILEIGDLKMAGTKKPDDSPQPSSAIKRVDRWECGTEGHTHTSEAEAKSCAEFETHVMDVIKGVQSLATHAKQGRTLTAEASALLRSTVDAVAPAPVAATEEETEDDGDETEEDETVDETSEEEHDLEVELDDEELEKMITEAVGSEIGRVTGRV